jgi:hypothetical protein
MYAGFPMLIVQLEKMALPVGAGAGPGLLAAVPAVKCFVAPSRRQECSSGGNLTFCQTRGFYLCFRSLKKRNSFEDAVDSRAGRKVDSKWQFESGEEHRRSLGQPPSHLEPVLGFTNSSQKRRYCSQSKAVTL